MRLPPQTPLASPVSSLWVWSCSSKQMQTTVADGANTLSYNLTTVLASVNYRVCEASIRAKAITAVIRWRGGGLHGYERGAAIAPQTHSDRWRLDRQFLWIRFSRFMEAAETKNQVICGNTFLIDSYISTVEKNPCIFNLKAQLEDIELKKKIIVHLWLFLKSLVRCKTWVLGVLIRLLKYLYSLLRILHYRSTWETHFIAY